MPFVKAAGLCLNLLALIALTLEAHDYFSRQLTASYAKGPFTAYANGAYAVAQGEGWISSQFEFPLAQLDYAEVVDAETFEPVTLLRGTCLALLAVKVGPVRLIDNLLIEEFKGESGGAFSLTL